jgi:hypothetical protein
MTSIVFYVVDCGNLGKTGTLLDTIWLALEFSYEL